MKFSFSGFGHLDGMDAWRYIRVQHCDFRSSGPEMFPRPDKWGPTNAIDFKQRPVPLLKHCLQRPTLDDTFPRWNLSHCFLTVTLCFLFILDTSRHPWITSIVDVSLTARNADTSEHNTAVNRPITVPLTLIFSCGKTNLSCGHGRDKSNDVK